MGPRIRPQVPFVGVLMIREGHLLSIISTRRDASDQLPNVKLTPRARRIALNIKSVPHLSDGGNDLRNT